MKTSKVTVNKLEIQDGFKYEAWIGHCWTPVVYPHTGFSKNQIEDAFKRGIARCI